MWSFASFLFCLWFFRLFGILIFGIGYIPTEPFVIENAFFGVLLRSYIQSNISASANANADVK